MPHWGASNEHHNMFCFVFLWRNNKKKQYFSIKNYLIWSNELWAILNYYCSFSTKPQWALLEKTVSLYLCQAMTDLTVYRHRCAGCHGLVCWPHYIFSHNAVHIFIIKVIPVNAHIKYCLSVSGPMNWKAFLYLDLWIEKHFLHLDLWIEKHFCI